MASPPGDDPTGVGILDALAERVRESAVWLVSAFGAVGLLLIPGLQLADLGKLDGSRLWIAVGSAAVAAVALGLGAALIAPFLRSNATTIADLAAATGSRERAVVAALDANPTLFQGEACGVADLNGRHAAACRAIDAAQAGVEPAKAALARADARLVDARWHERRCRERARRRARAALDEHEERLAGARGWNATVLQASGAVEAVARFTELDVGFRRAAKWLVLCTIVVAAAMAALAIAAHPPTPGAADFSGVTLVGADLSGASLREATFADATLTRVDLSDANLDGADVEGVAWRDVTCPDGRNSDDLDGTCEQHLVPVDGADAGR
jgi:uncharacterized protein YjbI with pentapeptide repeats